MHAAPCVYSLHSIIPMLYPIWSACSWNRSVSTALFSSAVSRVSANQQHSPPVWATLQKHILNVGGRRAASATISSVDGREMFDTRIHIFQTLVTLCRLLGCQPGSSVLAGIILLPSLVSVLQSTQIFKTLPQLI